MIKIKTKISILDYMILFVSIVFVSIVYFYSSIIWPREDKFKKVDRSRMETLDRAQKLHKILTGDFTEDGAALYALIEALQDTLDGDEFFEGEKDIVLANKFKRYVINREILNDKNDTILVKVDFSNKKTESNSFIFSERIKLFADYLYRALDKSIDKDEIISRVIDDLVEYKTADKPRRYRELYFNDTVAYNYSIGISESSSSGSLLHLLDEIYESSEIGSSKYVFSDGEHFYKSFIDGKILSDKELEKVTHSVKIPPGFKNRLDTTFTTPVKIENTYEENIYAVMVWSLDPTDNFIDKGNGVWDPAEDFMDSNKNSRWDDAEKFTENNGRWDIGEEIINDDGNGVWDPAEPFVDAGNGVWDDFEPFEDVNLNGRRDRGEKFTDLNGNGVWDDAEKFEDQKNGKYDLGESFEDRGNGKWDLGEPFIDKGNGKWDLGEPFNDSVNGKYDLGEPFTDLNGNGVWDDAEKFIDIDENGKYDLFEPYRDTDQNDKWTPSEPFADQVNGKYDLGEPFEDENGKWDPGESFTDIGNGKWDSGESFTDGNGRYDFGEPFEDIGNKKYDLGEEFSDSNGNGVWDDAEEFIDSNNKYNFGEDFLDCTFIEGKEVCNDVWWRKFIANRVWDDAEGFRDCGFNANNEVICDAELFIDSNGNGVWDPEEDFKDSNNNNRWDDAGEGWDASFGNGVWDDAEKFSDLNGNGIWDPSEPFIDRGNGRWDEGEDYYDIKYLKTSLFNEYKGEEYEDLNSNRRWDSGEPFVDANSNGERDGKISYLGFIPNQDTLYTVFDKDLDKIITVPSYKFKRLYKDLKVKEMRPMDYKVVERKKVTIDYLSKSDTLTVDSLYSSINFFKHNYTDKDLFEIKIDRFDRNQYFANTRDDSIRWKVSDPLSIHGQESIAGGVAFGEIEVSLPFMSNKIKTGLYFDKKEPEIIISSPTPKHQNWIYWHQIYSISIENLENNRYSKSSFSIPTPFYFYSGDVGEILNHTKSWID